MNDYHRGLAFNVGHLAVCQYPTRGYISSKKVGRAKVREGHGVVHYSASCGANRPVGEQSNTLETSACCFAKLRGISNHRLRSEHWLRG